MADDMDKAKIFSLVSQVVELIDQTASEVSFLYKEGPGGGLDVWVEIKIPPNQSFKHKGGLRFLVTARDE